MPRGNLRDVLTLGPSRRRRRMRRQMRALDRYYAREARDPRSRGDGLRRVLVGTATLVVAALATMHVLHAAGLSLDLAGVHVRRGAGPAERVAGSTSFRFLQQQPGTREPVTYDPCRPIHVVVNDVLAPRGADGVVQEAVEAVAAATGLRITLDGATTEQPTPDRPLRDRGRYGSGWSPVLVAWTTPRVAPELAGDIAGYGGSDVVRDELTARRWYVTGTVALDTPDLARALRLPGGRAEVRAIVMHELGHVVGLDHVDDPGEVMNESAVGRTTWGPGDRAGLALLGQGRCG